MKRTVRLLVVCVGLSLAAGAGSAFAQADAGSGKPQSQKQCHHRKDRHERFAELAGKLGLTDQQKARMKEVFAKDRPLIKPIVSRLMDEKHQMRTLIRSGSADEAAIRAQAAKVAGVEADLAVQRARMAKELRAILTPEQIEKFKAIQKERDERLDKFRKRMDERFDHPEGNPEG
ncbi:MAG TPA: Spy/CpxP family protein refolding chaperone [Bacteroidota bacterium]